MPYTASHLPIHTPVAEPDPPGATWGSTSHPNTLNEMPLCALLIVCFIWLDAKLYFIVLVPVCFTLFCDVLIGI